MKNAMTAALFGGALCCAGVADAKDTYRIMGPSTVAHPSNSSYAWDGADMADFRAALDYSYYFSHFVATVDTSISNGDFDYLNYVTLQRADCIVSPWWSDNDLTGYQAYIGALHFWSGGDLLLFNDDSYHDYIADYLGVPTQSYASSFTFNDSTFPFDGPFGTTTSVQASGNVGFLSDVDVANTGGRVLARNGSGQIMVAFWDDGDYAPGSGRMIIVTDADTVSTAFGNPTYFPLNDNGRFGLNLVAGLIGPDGCNDADCDNNGVLNVDDVECFVDTFLGGCN
ncbi:MAG: hypothetical protein DHS20C14_11590 [Phycisphaeraceae bacterium]|nr:MAG: hypothetical protein DHS20C14_11590 [Phycisphaeraceae bacterium]